MKRQIAVLLFTAVSGAVCQQRPELPLASAAATERGTADSTSKAPLVKETLAVNDQVIISTNDVAGIGDKPIRIDLDGTVTLPLVGKIRAEGLTIEQFQKELVDQLRVYVRSPQVSVKLLAARSGSILVSGAFKNPGVYSLPARRPLLEVLSIVGGLQPNAARMIKITRRLDRGGIPLPSAIEDPVLKVSTATVNLNRLVENPGAAEDIFIEPSDVLSAETAGTVYLTGEVLRAGAFELVDRDSVGVAELISQAGGFSREAAPDKSKVLRQILNGSKRAEIPVNLVSILDGRTVDFPVLPNDIVVVPRSKGKSAAIKSVLRIAVPTVVTTLIYVAIRD